MDFFIEPTLLLPTGTPSPPREDTTAGATFVLEDPGMVGARANLTAECCRRTGPDDSERPGNVRKDVKIEGTNSTSHLESTKASKNELKITPKLSRKTR